jgi:hypothetical protein
VHGPDLVPAELLDEGDALLQLRLALLELLHLHDDGVQTLGFRGLVTLMKWRSTTRC